MSHDAATIKKPGSAPLNWDLESLFSGGAKGAPFTEFRADLKARIEKARTSLSELPEELSADSEAAWESFILESQDIVARIEHAGAFSGCLISENVADDQAQSVNAEVLALQGKFLEMITGFEALTRAQSDSAWESLVTREKLAPIRFALDETRTHARLKLPSEMEALAAQLAVDGYHGWNVLYDKMAGDLTVEWEEDGKSSEISLGQLATKMNNADNDVRRRAFEKLNEAWKSRAALAAMALNYQAGFRLSLYNRRGWKSPVDEPLRMNRMSRATLDAMWLAINESKGKLAGYVDAKKKLLGLDAFRWYDETAPVGSSSATFSWDEAWDFVIRNVGDFSEDMKAFCEMARDRRWVEGEDRPGKAGGGFCTGFPLAKETRIFMTYGETYGDLSTLAHELGHSYHSFVLKDHDFLATQYPMNLAETASTFNELLVIDAALNQCEDDQERLMLLDQKMQSALTFFCNIQTRFIFDESFYAARENGMLTPGELSDLMVKAQKSAYGDLLADDGVHPLFWASKMHFFFTEVPFYNFPYTFGYLFATGVYAHALKEEGSFANGYRAMLSDTGSMSAEEVARKHLGVDLTKPDFWRMAVEKALLGLDDFIKLAG